MSTLKVNTPIKHDCAYIVLRYVENTSVNNDPDAGRPRQDPATGHIIASAVSLKRQWRDYWISTGQEVFVQRGDLPIETLMSKHAATLGIEYTGGESDDDDDDTDEATDEADPTEKKAKKKAKNAAEQLRKKRNLTTEQGRQLRGDLAKKYLDIRLFGQTIMNVQSQRGPVQVANGESIYPAEVVDMGITRCIAQTQKEIEKNKNKANQTMGRMPIISRALVRHNVYVSKILALSCNVSMEDLQILEEAMRESPMTSRSSVRDVPNFAILRVTAETDSASLARAVRGVKVTAKSKKNNADPGDLAHFDAEDYTITIPNVPGVRFDWVVEPITDAPAVSAAAE